MAFEKYIRTPRGMSKLDGKAISLSKTEVNFGKTPPGYEYLTIEFDRDHQMIRFSEGTAYDGTTVQGPHGHKTGYYINVARFMQRGYLPKGVYLKVDGDLTYQLAETYLKERAR